MFGKRTTSPDTTTTRTSSRTRVITRSTIAAGVLAAATFAGGTQAHADVDGLTLSANINCNALTEVVTVFNSNAVDIVANVVLQGSMQNTSLTTTVPANGAANVTFDIAVGERIDKIILRDDSLKVLLTIFTDIVITGTGDCKRPAFNLVELTEYSLTCNGGVTHAAITLENNGDYPANINALGSYWFTTDEEREAAQQAGLISADAEVFTLAPGADSSFDLDFKVVDAMVVSVNNKQTEIFADGPRVPVAGEGCVSAPATTVEETIPEETVPEDTTPEDTTPQDTTPQDTTPQDTLPTDTLPTDTIATESGSATPTTAAEGATTVPTTALAAAAAAEDVRALPVTGRGSMPVGFIGALLFAAGLGLVRATRRRSA